MYSDCGTNFVGAKNILNKEFESHIGQLHREIPELAVRERISWHFNPPASPHFGGLWEAAVKSTKLHLRHILKQAKLTFEELTTVVTQVEACLNSRPLYPMSNDPSDLNALTPGHFLIGDALLAVPEQSYLDLKEHTLRRWQYVQQMTQGFWKRWQLEYLSQLQQRAKWNVKNENLEVGRLVLIKDEKLPPSRWLLARAIKIYRGHDNLVRVVVLKTKDGVIERSVARLCPLPILENENHNETEN